MGVNLRGRSFLKLLDFTTEEIRYLLDLAHDLKAKKRSGDSNYLLKGKNIVLLFYIFLWYLTKFNKVNRILIVFYWLFFYFMV